ncbi:hypothetical protein [Dactylosporangium matsuzakiense]|uniref:hypothetical protein n=1 Tax=Dactylosporangium matsuzakiense TaxID=53360 RepID=UPI0021C35E6A|nr:hypothetical protein [Dactylosporangium matsuzakiense]UWZ44029.1 hypothetical protein Dmats_42615 [Dactylosporangium matsuzakiense]
MRPPLALATAAAPPAGHPAAAPHGAGARSRYRGADDGARWALDVGGRARIGAAG